MHISGQASLDTTLKNARMALQKRYPTDGTLLGLSDLQLHEFLYIEMFGEVRNGMKCIHRFQYDIVRNEHERFMSAGAVPVCFEPYVEQERPADAA